MTSEKEAVASGASESESKAGAPPPPLAMGEELRNARTRGQRSLFISVMLMFLVSIVVFVIGTYFFVVPQVIRQNLDVQQLKQDVKILDTHLARSIRSQNEPVLTPAVLDEPPAAAPAPADAPADPPADEEAAAPKAAAPKASAPKAVKPKAP